MRKFWIRQTVRPVAVAVVLAGLLAGMVGPDIMPRSSLRSGTTTTYAQGGMDIGLVSPSFRGLPSSVRPGEQFTVTAITAPGAWCVGSVTFRNHPPIALDDQAAPAGTCTWTVTVPPTTRPGTAIVEAELKRNGQSWALHGVTYVSPVGESR